MTSDYDVAVHALVYLAHKGCILSSDALAENICTNPARVRKVMSRLKQAGLVESSTGADGGYKLAKSPNTIPLDAIADAVGGSFVSANWHSGDSDMDCLVASGMAGIMDNIYEDLDDVCHEHLAQISVGDIVSGIFGNTKERAEA